MSRDPEFLLDTSTVSYLIRGTNELLSRKFEKTSINEIVLSSVTVGEVLYGLEKKPEATRLSQTVRALISNLAILPWTEKTATSYAKLRAFAENLGVTVSHADLMIGSHASEHDLILVSSDGIFSKLHPRIITHDWTNPSTG